MWVGLLAGCTNPPLLGTAIRAELCSVSLRECPSRTISFFFCSAQFQPRMLLVQELSRAEVKNNETLLLFFCRAHTPYQRNVSAKVLLFCPGKDLHPNLFQEKDLFGKESRRMAAFARVEKDSQQLNR